MKHSLGIIVLVGLQNMSNHAWDICVSLHNGSDV